MTNYEWLVGTDKLQSFILGLHEVKEKYDVLITQWEIPRTSQLYLESICNWLIQEHQEPKAKEYVLLEDVILLLKELQADGTINEFLCIERTLREHLKVKEIDVELK